MKETKAQRKAIEALAEDAMQHIVKVARVGSRVVAIHGNDAETLCVCQHPSDAEVIVRLFTRHRAENL